MRIAMPIPALMMSHHDLGQILKIAAYLNKQFLTKHRMTAHDIPLSIIQRAWLAQNRIGNTNLADIVEHSPEANCLHLLLGTFQLSCRRLSILDHTQCMFTCILISKPSCTQQCPQRCILLIITHRLDYCLRDGITCQADSITPTLFCLIHSAISLLNQDIFVCSMYSIDSNPETPTYSNLSGWDTILRIPPVRLTGNDRAQTFSRLHSLNLIAIAQ